LFGVKDAIALVVQPPVPGWRVAEQISNPEIRRAAFDDIAIMLEQFGLPANQRLQKLLSLSEVPEEWKKPWQ
jgi:hypothetical protein